MFDFIHSHKKIIQIVLAIFIVPTFVVFGISSYEQRSDGGNEVASISGRPITQQEFAAALQNQQNSVQQMMGGKVDASMLDSPELRSAALEGLIRQRLLIDQAARGSVLISDQQLQQAIASEPAFQEDGKFSPARYQEILQRQGMTPLVFESGLRRELMLRRITDAYGRTAVAPATLAERLLQLSSEQREVSVHAILPGQFVGQVNVDDAAARAYYEAHHDEFQVPAQARLQYLALSLDAVAAQQQVSAEEARLYYEQNSKQYAQREERQASHILIAVDPAASAEQKQAARDKAEQLLKQARQNPAAFADLARRNSQDPGSAAKGGDLGFFPRGVNAPAFDDAVFKMKVGEVIGPVETPFGYHLIRLNAVKGKGFDDMKAQVELDLKKQKAARKFSELGEQFNNLVFEQGDSLKPAADVLKLAVKESGWVTRSGGADKLLNNPKLAQAVFSDDVLKNKRNTEVIDVGDNTLVAARVLEYKPASLRPYAEVSAQITNRLKQEQAAALALKAGRALLGELKEGKTPELDWASPKLASRQNSQGYSRPLLEEVFKADSDKLPAYVGTEDGKGGFVIAKVTRVVAGDSADPAKRNALRDQLRSALGLEQLKAYIESLKAKGEVKIRQEAVGKKEG